MVSPNGRRTEKKALSIAMAGITLPFILEIGVSFILRHNIAKGTKPGSFIVFMGVAISITSFPVLARILAEQKLLTIDVGKMAMSTAAVNDMASWILLALPMALSGSGRSQAGLRQVSYCCSMGFLVWFGLHCFVFIHYPSYFQMDVPEVPGRRLVDEFYFSATLSVVLAAGFVTDTIGIHALFGAFVVGILILKEGAFAGPLMEKVEDLVSDLFLLLYFLSSVLKTNVASIKRAQSWGLLVLVICTACLGKIVGTARVSLYCKVPFLEPLAFRLLMNTKSLVELILLNIMKMGNNRKIRMAT